MVKEISFQNIEQKLISECIGGNRLAQRELYEKLTSRMFSVCLRYVGDRETARDILHDGFITLFSKLDNYRGDGSFDGWARRIFVNTALMYLRKNDALKMAESLEKPGVEVAADSSVISRLDSAALMNIVVQMPVGFRAVFNLFVIEGFTHQEIAKMLKISEGGSRSQLSRARVWLKDRAKDFENDLH